MELNQFAEKLFAKGRERGLTDMELYFQSGSEFELRIYQQEIDNYSLAQSGGASFRGKYNGKFGYAYTEAMDEGDLEFLVESAIENATVVNSDDAAELYDGSGAYPDFAASSNLDVPAADKIQLAMAMEARALAIDSKVKAVNYCLYGDEAGETRIINTRGLNLSHSSSTAFAYVSVVVKDGDETKTASKFHVSSDFATFEADTLAEEAVAEALSKLGAKSVPSRNYPVILRNDVAGTLLQTFASVFSAESAQKGLSLLTGKVGASIASSVVTLIDDPLRPGGASSRPFDAEGVATARKEVISKGTLTTLLHNLKTAAKEGITSTGNAVKGSYKSPVSVAPSNFYVAKGAKSLKDLMHDMGEGIVITDVQGMHSGANAVSGDFSLAASGYLVVNGKAERAVEQITLAGNFFELLNKVKSVGSDLVFGLPSGAGTYGSPSILIEELAIAGD